MKLVEEKTALGVLELALCWRRQKVACVHLVGGGDPLGKVTGATSLLPPSKRGGGFVTPGYILITLSLRSLFFGEVNFMRQLVIPWVLFCSNWGKHGESFWI